MNDGSRWKNPWTLHAVCSIIIWDDTWGVFIDSRVLSSYILPGILFFFFCISFFSRRASVYIRACQPFSRLVHTYRSLPEFRFSYCIQSLNMSRYFFFKNFGNKLFIGEKKKEILVDKSVVRKPIEHVKKTEHFSSLGLPRNRFLHQSSYCFYWILYVNT